jgi:hypothetical protein
VYRLHYPVERWELLDHATRTNKALAPDPDSRTTHLLWTLPNRSYRSLDDVAIGLARTVRGHPRRRPDQPAPPCQADPST